MVSLLRSSAGSGIPPASNSSAPSARCGCPRGLAPPTASSSCGKFFLTIPDELSEAARIDGCSEFGIFWRIVLPLSRPALTVVALFSFMAAWNDFLGPLVYVQRPEQFTLALGLQSFQSQLGGSQWNLLMAAAVLVIVPVLLLFFLAQKTFIKGISTTGIKGRKWGGGGEGMERQSPDWPCGAGGTQIEPPRTPRHGDTGTRRRGMG